MFKVTARTIMELGAELISSDAIAFYELIKNGFDAGSDTGVTIEFNVVLGRRNYEEVRRQLISAKRAIAEGDIALDDTNDFIDESIIGRQLLKKLNSDASSLFSTATELVENCKTLDDLSGALEEIYALNTIIITDTGTGMSLSQLKEVFLVIGTPSRKRDIDAAIDANEQEAPHLGEKGIGRLAAMRLGDSLNVITATASDTHNNIISIDWSDFDDPTKMIEEIVIEPYQGKKKISSEYHGTQITVGKLNSDWSEKRVKRLAIDDISLLANPLGKASDKRIAIVWNGKRVPIHRLERSFLDYANAKIRGSYRPGLNGPKLLLRIDILDLGFGNSVETHIEELKSNDLAAAIIGPPAKSSRMNKRDSDYTALETIGPFDFEFYWFNRSQQRRARTTGEYHALRNLLDQWVGVRLYRDGFRVYPYGGREDDWLELDQKALRTQGYALNRIQMIGQVDIGRLKNPQLIDQTNREGLRHTPEEFVLKETLQFSIDRLREELILVTKAQKESKVQLTAEDKVSTVEIEARMKTAIRKLKPAVPDDYKDVIIELELMREELVRYAANAWDRIGEMEKEADQMLAMAGVGLMVEVVAHELSRTAEDALDTLNSLKKKTVPENVRRSLESLRASMKSISKRLRILDPLSVTGRQRKEAFNLDQLIREILEAHEAQFVRHGVKLDLFIPDHPIRVQAVKGMVVQVLENLISNSIYWMEIERERKAKFEPKLTISLEGDPGRIRFSDNGPGISKEYANKVFDLFFSLKDKSRRRGLGLYIAKEAAEHNNGALVLDTQIENIEGRYNTFDYRVTE